ncbi:hypothetical protein TNCV_1667671 [Trichonephila clavipes]|nr:hypothetical protein TNCV_1667671 [Trichonephila clavipes]
MAALKLPYRANGMALNLDIRSLRCMHWQSGGIEQFPWSASTLECVRHHRERLHASRALQQNPSLRAASVGREGRQNHRQPVHSERKTWILRQALSGNSPKEKEARKILQTLKIRTMLWTMVSRAEQHLYLIRFSIQTWDNTELSRQMQGKS